VLFKKHAISYMKQLRDVQITVRYVITSCAC